jgi:hypothetical protein
MKEGSLIFILKDEDCFLIRFFHLIGFAVLKTDSGIGKGFIISIFIWQFEIAFSLIKRRGDYVKRIEDEKGPQASA